MVLGKNRWGEYIQLEEEGYTHESIAFVVDGILKRYPECCVVLFGSRARGTNRPFSDFDLGVFSAAGISHSHYVELVQLGEELMEDFPVMVQVVTLCRADPTLLRQIGTDIKFLGSRMNDWITLRSRSNEG